MKVVFCIAKVLDDSGQLRILPIEFASYQEAEEDIKNYPPGKYQVQKFFVVE